MLDAKLVVVGGETQAKEFELHLPATIGRGRDSDIVIAHPLVSRTHCRLYEEDGRLMVHDLASLNGTFIGRDAIHRRALRPGELLTVGTVTFRAMYDDWSEDLDEECVIDSMPTAESDDETRLMGSSDETKRMAPHREMAVTDDEEATQPAHRTDPSAHLPRR